MLVKDRALAERLLKDVKKGKNFQALARDFSTCPSKAKGGDLGWFGPGKMAKPFEDAVKKLRHGAVSGIVKTQFGYHIIKKTGER
ncbi:MAG: peptidylprolyl isomerase [Spirochaetes bacterium]|nr:MAG: peptidylprolyl isomerase [Spirochaetota bacterium]